MSTYTDLGMTAFHSICKCKPTLFDINVSSIAMYMYNDSNDNGDSDYDNL